MLLLLFATGIASVSPTPIFENGPIFYVAEIDVVQPGSGMPLVETLGWGDTVWGVLSLTAYPQDTASTLRVSDLGYRSLAGDSIGVMPYPPYVAEAFQVDRGIALPPAEATTAGAWGQITLANDSGLFDGIALAANGDRRQVRIKRGQKTYDADRGIFVDPSYDTLEPVFYGLGMPWFLAETALNIPLSDAQYWLSLPVLSETYSGAGDYNGDANITAQFKPKTRGAAFNVTPKLIDSVDQIYQYTDGAGTVVRLYEGGAEVFTRDPDTTDLTIGSVAPGHFRTDNARGCFQLGSVPDPSFSITCDVTGEFPVSGVKTVLADIAYCLLTEDLGVSANYIDVSSFATAAANFPYTGGAYYASDSKTTGVEALAYLLTSFGAKPVSNRQGKLQCLNLSATVGIGTATFDLNITNIISIVPQAVDSAINPPPYRVRVAYKHNYTVQTSGLNTATATPSQLQYVAASDQYGPAINDDTLLAYARPNDLAPFGGALSNLADAQTVAAATLALFGGVACRVYEVTVPVEIGLALDLGEVGKLTYPMHDLRGGKFGQIYHESFKSDDGQITLLVLVTGAASNSSGLILADGNFLMLESAALPGWATSDVGLPPGAFYANGQFVSVVSGWSPAPGTPPIIWPGITAAALLAIGSAPVVNAPGTPGSGQLFLNGGFVCVA